MSATTGGTRPRTLIVEPNVHGHRLFYVRLLVEAALRRGDEVHVGTRADVLETPEGLEQLSSVSGWDLLPMTSKEIRVVEQASTSVRATTTVVPDGDSLAVSLGVRPVWRGSGDLSILIMREFAQPGRSALLTKAKDIVRRALIGRASRTRGVRVAILKSAGWSGNSSLPVAVDPVVLASTEADGRQFREVHGMQNDRYWFAILGALSSRKNIPLVADAIRSLNNFPVGLLLAGGVDSDARDSLMRAVDRLQARGVGVVWVDRLLSDHELDSAVRAADCVVLAHSNEGPSGLMGKALAAGTRVVGAGARSLRDDARRNTTLMEWSPLERSPLALALASAAGAGTCAPILGAGSDRFTTVLL